jgi:hypothetical protein
MTIRLELSATLNPKSKSILCKNEFYTSSWNQLFDKNRGFIINGMQVLRANTQVTLFSRLEDSNVTKRVEN